METELDHLVVEVLVFEDDRRGHGACRAGRGDGLFESELGGVDAEVVLSCLTEKCLCVDCAREMHVQVGSLGHLFKQGVQRQRTGFSGSVEYGCSVPFPWGCGNSLGSVLGVKRTCCEQAHRGEQRENGEQTSAHRLWYANSRPARRICRLGTIWRDAARLLY